MEFKSDFFKKNISQIKILDSKEIILCLEDGGEPSYQLIYRLAKGIYWNNKEGGFESRDAHKAPYDWWISHILKVLKEEFNIELLITSNTEWVNIPEAIIRRFPPSRE